MNDLIYTDQALKLGRDGLQTHQTHGCQPYKVLPEFNCAETIPDLSFGSVYNQHLRTSGTLENSVRTPAKSSCIGYSNLMMMLFPSLLKQP